MKLSLPKFQLALVLVLAAVSAAMVALICSASEPSFYFEVSLRSSSFGTAQTFYDIGKGFNEHDSERLPLRSAQSTAMYRFPLPEGEYRLIRFDPLDHGNAHLVINYARIVDKFGHTLRQFSLGELRVANDISASEIKDGRMSLILGPADNDSQLIINPGTPLALHMALSARLLFAGRTFLLYFLPLGALGMLWLKPPSFLKQPFQRPLLWAVALFAACLLYCVWAASIGWNDITAGPYEFRLTQTAITCFYMLRTPLTLAYQTPVLGPPWSVPMEFPLYQWLVVFVVKVFGTPLDQAGRLVSLSFFLLTLVPTYFLLGVCRVTRPHRLLFLAVIAVSPFYIFWARTFMIETTALFFSVAYLASAALYSERRTNWLIVSVWICGTLAALVKITTFALFAIPVVVFLTKDLFRRPLRLSQWIVVGQRLAPLVLAVGVPLAVGLWWTHYADQVKEENPLGHYLTSTGLMEWNFGSLRQRLSIATWHTLLDRTPSLLTYDKAFWIGCLIAVILTRRRWKEVGACFLLYLSAPAIFTNLYVVHEYYMCANGIFLLGAAGFCIIGVLEAPGGQKVGFAAALVTVSLAFVCHKNLYLPIQRQTHRAFASHVKELVKNTERDSVIVFLGFDYSSVWPYYGERRALMLPTRQRVSDSDVQRALRNLQGYKIGGIIVTGQPIYPLESLLTKMKALGLDTSHVKVVDSSGWDARTARSSPDHD